jgi:hypothetical protein
VIPNAIEWKTVMTSANVELNLSEQAHGPIMGSSARKIFVR